MDMADDNPQGWTMAELGRRIDGLGEKIDATRDELSKDISELDDKIEKMGAKVVWDDVYQARHTALRDEMMLLITGMSNTMEVTSKQAASALTIAKWALGALITLIGIVAAISLQIASNGGSP